MSRARAGAPALEEMIGVGPRTAAELRAVRIRTPRALVACGAVAAWRRVARRRGTDPGLRLLWTLEGAVSGIPAAAVPDARRRELRTMIGRLDAASPSRRVGSTARSTVRIAPPSPGDRAEFLAAVRQSRTLHGRWIRPPSTTREFNAFVARAARDTHRSYLIRTGDRELVGVVNANEIVRGLFQSAYLGYYAFRPLAGTGLMGRGLAAVIDRLFGTERLHRLEANIQPDNNASIALVRRLGFRLEGYSPRYLRIAGRWRDHERWALLSDEWRRPSRRRRLHADR